ncbi:MAG TPA: Smr/MutS family protein [Pseudonocardiaceae bacterium]
MVTSIAHCKRSSTRPLPRRQRWSRSFPGKGSGALKKRVLRFLEQKEIKSLYHRVEKDSNNFGRIFVHFRWK